MAQNEPRLGSLRKPAKRLRGRRGVRGGQREWARRQALEQHQSAQPWPKSVHPMQEPVHVAVCALGLHPRVGMGLVFSRDVYPRVWSIPADRETWVRLGVPPLLERGLASQLLGQLAAVCTALELASRPGARVVLHTRSAELEQLVNRDVLPRPLDWAALAKRGLKRLRQLEGDLGSLQITTDAPPDPRAAEEAGEAARGAQGRFRK